MLIEIARKKGNYVPEVSFGTHFFQDLVESNIKYLPLYPDDDGIIFNEKFLIQSENIFENLLPEYYYLQDTIRVIDVVKSTGGMILRVLMNAEYDEAIAMFVAPSMDIQIEKEIKESVNFHPSDHWRWRMKMAEKIASELDGERFGVKGIYIFGSTKDAVSGPSSDIDLIVHIDKEKCKKYELELWFEGWSLCLSEINYLRTGVKTQGLLDVHYITDDDIENKTSYALKISALTEAAHPLKLKSRSN